MNLIFRINTRYLIAFLCLSATVCSAQLEHAYGQTIQKPNVVFIMADDVGLGDIGFYHRKRTDTEPLAPTPNLDALALAGMRFSDAHSSTALCSPSRYCAMSGNLNYRSYAPWGVWGSFRPSPFTEEDATLGRVAKQGGLSTAFIGKWHLGGDFMKADGSGIYRKEDAGDKSLGVDVSQIISGGPQSLGFDYSFTLPCGIQGPLYVAYENGKWRPFSTDSKLIYLNKETAADPAFVSDKGNGEGDSHWDTRKIGPLISSKAVDFIREQAGNDQPFLLYYCSPMVHIPHLPPAEFDGRKVNGATPTPHLDMVIDLDQQVGRIINALKEEGVYDNTLFIFSSDNGGLLDGRATKLGHQSSGGYRGSKNLPYEGGHRVPFFAVWPKRIAAQSESDEMVALHDVIATLASATGVKLAENQALDSLDLLPLLTGDSTFTGREELLLQAGSHTQVIYRKGDWKLIIQTNHKITKWEPMALFNLGEDVFEDESKNYINNPHYSELVQQMLSRYLEIRESGARTIPAGNHFVPTDDSSS